MKKIGYLIIGVFILTQVTGKSDVNAQRGERRQQLIESEKVAFFTSKLDLDTQEAEKFWPLYNDYSSRIKRIRDQKRSSKRYIVNNKDNVTDKEYGEMADKYVELTMKEAQLMKDYHTKFLQILPVKKVAKLYIAEDQFKAFLLKKLRQNRQQKGRAAGGR